MSAIKNVILVGATGNLGPSILKALQANPNFNITILTREGSAGSYNAPPGVKLLTADYTSSKSLVSAFSGQDAVVSTVGASAFSDQTKHIDAAIEAGVKYFIPSEFGSDTSNEKTQDLAVFSDKVKVRKYLVEKAAEGKINWIIINNGPFFDWGLKAGFLGFNIAAKKATLYNGGSVPFSTTTLTSVGASVAAALSNPGGFKDRVIYVHSAITTQRSILAVYEKFTGQKWEVEEKDTADIQKETNAKLAQGDYSTIWQLILSSLFGEGYGGEFKEVSNEALGVEVLDEKGIEEVIRQSL